MNLWFTEFAPAQTEKCEDHFEAICQTPPSSRKRKEDLRVCNNNEDMQDTAVRVLCESRENEMRPTVLMLAGSNGAHSPVARTIAEVIDDNSNSKVVVVQQEENIIQQPLLEDNQKWLGALALMELSRKRNVMQ